MSTMTEESDSDDGTPIECDRCGYEWIYSGQMWRATCPNCGHKMPTGLKPDDLDE